MSASPESEPTQDQLNYLRDTVLSYEPVADLFDGMPSDVDVSDFTELTAPLLFDENLALAAVLKTPDNRAIWLSIFRNPDNREIAKTTILVLDPKAGRGEAEPTKDEDYVITEIALGRLVIERVNTSVVTSAELTDLQQLIDSSKEISPLFELE